MDFDLTEDHRAVREMADALFAAHGGDEYVKQLADAGRTWDERLWQRLGEGGLFSLALDEEHGGSGLGMLEFALALEQQGRYLASAPWWAHHLVTLAVARFGTAGLKARSLPGLIDGTTPATLAIEAVECGAPKAAPRGDALQLDGVLAAVPIDSLHRLILIPVQTEAGRRLALIDAALPGVTRTSGVLTDLQPVHDLHFANATVAADSLLTADALPWLEERIALCIGALQTGVLAEALQRTARFTTERHQFGRPLGSFQGLAMRAADAYIEVELLRSTVWQLAWRLDNNLPATAAARTAKLHAARAGHVVGHTVQHLHGGTGTDLTYPIHRFFLKSQALAAMGGGQETQLARIGRELAGPRFEEYLHA